MSRAPVTPQLSESLIRGALVPTGGTFPVTGVHRGIINLRADDFAGTYLISVVSDPAHWTELAILASPWHPWWGQLRSVGDQVPLGGIDSRSASPPQPAPNWPEISSAAVQAAREVLLRDFSDQGFVPLLLPEPPREDPFVRRAAGLLRDAPDRTVSSISNLIGLGIGFTPAGDDFISGVLLAQMLTSGAPPSATDRSAVFARLHATTAGGSSLLRVAAAGFPPAYQLSMVDALAREEVIAAIGIAQRHGHSSGLDALSGLLWAI